MAAPLDPNFWIEERITRTPESAGTLVRRISSMPLGLGAQGRVDGRIRSISTITRSLSDIQGNWVRGRFSWEETDTDAYNRILLDDPETEAVINRQVSVFFHSEQGRKALNRPYNVFTGVITESPLSTRMGAGRTANDWLGSRQSPFSLDKKILQNRRITRDLWPNVSNDFIDNIQPAVLGEQSDQGTTDPVTGEDIARGKVVCIPIGKTGLVTQDGETSPATEETQAEFLPPPILVSATVHGTPGNNTFTYGIWLATANGQSTISNEITVTNAPDKLDANNYVELVWRAPDGYADKYEQFVIGYFIGGRSHNPVSTYLDINRHALGGDGLPDWTTGGIGTTYRDDQDHDIEKTPGPPDTNSAQIEVTVTVGGQPATYLEWSTYLVCCHAVNPADLHQLYGPTWTSETDVARKLLPESVFGSFVLAPGRPGWALGTTYVDYTDMRTGKVHRTTVMFARGAMAEYADKNKGGFAWNMCGMEDVGDGTGQVIQRAAYILQHLLSEFVAANNGDGYFSGLWAGLPYFSDGVTSLIDTDSIQAVQQYFVDRIGGLGYLGGFQIRDDITVGELISRFNVSYFTRSGPNTYGQFKLAVKTIATPPGYRYRSGIEIEQLGDIEVDYTTIENRTRYSFNRDYELNKFLSEVNQIEVEASFKKYKEWCESDIIEQWWVSDRRTAKDAMSRRSSERAYHQVYQEFTTKMIAIRDDIGNRVEATHPQGLGTDGYVDRPFFIERMDLDAKKAQYVIRASMIRETAQVLLKSNTLLGVGIILHDHADTDPYPDGVYTL